MGSREKGRNSQLSDYSFFSPGAAEVKACIVLLLAESLFPSPDSFAVIHREGEKGGKKREGVGDFGLGRGMMD